MAEGICETVGKEAKGHAGGMLGGTGMARRMFGMWELSLPEYVC